MPATIHEFFLKNVEQAIENQLNSIRCGSEKAALFAQKIRLFGSPTIEFPTGSERHVPDSAFGRKKATYPGVIIEVANSQKAKDLNRLAEDYLVGSRASVQAVVGLDIEYGNTESRKATLSVWRTQVVQTDTTKQLRVIQEPANEVCSI
jgi:Uma2 family endonuclease